MPMMGRTDEYLWIKACKMKSIPIQEYEQKKRLLLKKYYNYLEEELAKCKDAHLHICVKELIEESAKKHNLGLLTGNFEKSAKIKKNTAELAISQREIDFKSLDGEAAYIFLLLVAPGETPGPHLKALAKISRLLDDKFVRDRLRGARSNQEVMKLIKDEEQKKTQ